MARWLAHPLSTSRSLRVGALSVAAALAAAGVTGAAGTTPAATGTAHPGSEVAVTVTGKVSHKLRLTLAELSRLPAHTVSVTYQARNGSQAHTYSGPLLYDVLEQAQPRVRPQVKNDLLRDYVAATAASDGYRAVVAWGEIDPSYEAKQVLLADNEDGTPLTGQQLVLVVPGDKFGGRYVSGVTSLRLGRADS